MYQDSKKIIIIKGKKNKTVRMIVTLTVIIILVAGVVFLVRLLEVVGEIEVIGVAGVAGVVGLKRIEIIFKIENIVLWLVLKCDAKVKEERIRRVRENSIENPSMFGNTVLQS